MKNEFFEGVKNESISLVEKNKFSLLYLQDKIHENRLELIQEIVTNGELENLHPSIIYSIILMTKNLGINIDYLNNTYERIKINYL